MNEDNSPPAVGVSSRPGQTARWARLVDLSPVGLLLILVVFFGLAAALASIGGWAGIVAVLCLAAVWVAGVIAVCDV